MSISHTSLRLVAGALVLLMGSPALGQDLETMQLFGPADVSPYGSGIQPREGYFFVFDGISWAISAPKQTSIGFPGLTRRVFHNMSTEEIQHNSHNTGPFEAQFTEGNRIEFGQVHDRHGWFVSVFQLNTQTQGFATSNVDIVFEDIAFGGGGQKHLEGFVSNMVGYIGNAAQYVGFELRDLPVMFDEVFVENRVETWGVEWMCIHQLRPLRHGGNFEFFAGVRYMEFDDTFSVDARGTERTTTTGVPINGAVNSRFVYDTGPDGDATSPIATQIGPGVILADSNWSAEAENHIVGPQIGARWSKTKGRWRVSAEGRFFAGLNSQNIRSQGVLGSELAAAVPWSFDISPVDPNDPLSGPPGYPYMPVLREPYNFDHTEHLFEFSPAAEIRIEGIYQLTRAVFIKAGWTAIWMDGIARGSNIIDYTISEPSVMGINAAENSQDVFMHGLNIGVTVNR